MRLLLDVHHSPVVAERFRSDGHDVVAAAEDPMLAVLTDEDLLRAAAAGGRALVTENVRDFDRIVRAWAAARDHHAGVVFTSRRRYHRGSRSYPKKLVEALRLLLGDPQLPARDGIYWLP